MGEGVALSACALYALDYTAIVYAAALLDPVPLANLFLLLMVMGLLRATHPSPSILCAGAYWQGVVWSCPFWHVPKVT
ncbi:MAG UNVERIFIED_CONTAM: hypothetical protein LVT10_02605 [Anaerolineae bacterium]